MATKNLSRDGAAKKLGPVAIHDGMYHFREGALIRGYSKTQVGNILDDEKFVATPRVEKNLAPVTINQGCRSRQNDPAN
jgi:hypothetical protein